MTQNNKRGLRHSGPSESHTCLSTLQASNPLYFASLVCWLRKTLHIGDTLMYPSETRAMTAETPVMLEILLGLEEFCLFDSGSSLDLLAPVCNRLVAIITSTALPSSDSAMADSRSAMDLVSTLCLSSDLSNCRGPQGTSCRLPSCQPCHPNRSSSPGSQLRGRRPAEVCLRSCL